MNKHTPAHWRNIQCRLIGSDGTDVVAAGVGLGLGSDNGDGVRTANARLILAAPELLEALRFSILAFEGDSLDEIESQYGHGTMLRVRKGRSAIAKAEGKA